MGNTKPLSISRMILERKREHRKLARAVWCGESLPEILTKAIEFGFKQGQCFAPSVKSNSGEYDIDSVGNNIRTLRQAKRLSQGQLSKLIGTTAATLSDYERGKISPPVNRLLGIISSLNCSADDLLRGKL